MARAPGQAPTGIAEARARIHDRLEGERGTLGLHQPAAICMAYPSPYRVGMSSLGFQTLYRRLNELGLGAHRAFLPDAWEAQALPWPQPHQPILSYEAERPLGDYPIVGVSVAYELELSGLVRLLEGAGIPPLARDRGRAGPIVVAGGPLTFSNPFPLLPFVDVLVLGEAEALLPRVVERLAGAAGREAGLAAVAELEHVVLGEIEGPMAGGDLPPPAKAPAELLPAHAAIVTPDTELADMFLIEPERGCSRPCTFCVMRQSTNGGMRLQDPQAVLSRIPDHARRVGLVGAAVTDHPRLEPLVDAIIRGGRGVGISSLRADRLTPTLLENLRRGGYRQITVASDGISERMRTLLDRRIREESLLRAAHMVRAADFRGLKVYEMIGAPGETEDDVDELIECARRLAAIVPLTLTFSTFVPKRNTPLDGQPFLGAKPALARIKKIRKGLAGVATLRPQSPRWAHVEYLLARAGAEGGHAALAATHAGGRYRDWIRAFERMPPPSRPLRYGDEEAWARRKGRAAERRPKRPGDGLPVVS